MKKILIADSNKSSLVMTSEIFKDCYPGIQVCTAQTAQDAIAAAKNNTSLDVFVIDFDLPDQNGVQTAIKIKKFSPKPIILTAFDQTSMLNAFGKQLDKHKDIQIFLRKPLHLNMVQAYCEYYCKKNYQFQKPISCRLSVLVAFINSDLTIKPVYYPAFVDECCLHSVRVQLTDNLTLKNFKSVNQCLIRFQDPNEIELGQNVSFDSICDLDKNKLMDKFCYELKGKIVSQISLNKTDTVGQNFWMKFEDVHISQRILEAILRDLQNKQYYAMQRFF